MKAYTIADLIDNLNLDITALKAGRNKIDNMVYGAGIIENPDYYDWFSAGDFILTTGYIFKDDVALQKKLVKELAEQNCSGLGIKLRKYWNEIPQNILDEADLRGLPIVEIPFTYSLSQVSKKINYETSSKEDSMLHKFKNIHDAFSKCSIDGGDLWQISKLTSELIGNPIVILDSRFNLLSYSEVKNNPHKLANHLQLVTREKVFPKSFTDTIPTETKEFTLSIKRRLLFDGQQIVCRVIPIAYSQTIYGYIIVWEVMHKLDYVDYMALENAAQSAALERVKTKQMVEAEHKQKEGFFDDLLEGKILSVNAVISLAKIHGMDPTKNHICAVVSVNDADKSVMKEIQNICEDVTMRLRRKTRTIIRENNVLLFMELMDNESKYEIGFDIREYISTIDNEIFKTHQSLQYRIGVSNVTTDFLNIGKASLLAQDALRLASNFNNNERVVFFTDFASFYLLDNAFDKNKLINFFDVTLGILKDYDNEHNTRFMDTLESYFKANGVASDAAKAMFIHRNTFIYRMEKIKKILKNDLKNAEQNFNYQLAFHINRIINTNK